MNESIATFIEVLWFFSDANMYLYNILIQNELESTS